MGHQTVPLIIQIYPIQGLMGLFKVRFERATWRLHSQLLCCDYIVRETGQRIEHYSSSRMGQYFRWLDQLEVVCSNLSSNNWDVQHARRKLPLPGAVPGECTFSVYLNLALRCRARRMWFQALHRGSTSSWQICNTSKIDCLLSFYNFVN